VTPPWKRRLALAAVLGAEALHWGTLRLLGWAGRLAPAELEEAVRLAALEEAILAAAAAPRDYPEEEG
jgi:hypothetical protein